MTLLTPIGSDGDHLLRVTFDTRVNSLHSKKRQSLRLARMPTCLLDGSVRKVRNKSLFHFPITIWAMSRCHLRLHIPVKLEYVTDRTFKYPRLSLG